ncbi:alkaline phosphatase [Actinocrispum wychmicini]|uniref:Alkaline phosphatase/streptomycin-6-phosphatase n=1 Tax=Actinocrispum wychmicini TaxID=1213861 RepID=A0A4R2IVV4_9PSEU|nr:alkaline phosphatase [Actinocrispum wychmicini]TCO49843.1 alkaline phosphatase/streptomycin-6-phosphatase [Actinocrispum wychmicini]
MRRRGVTAVVALSLLVAAVGAGSAAGSSSDHSKDGAVFQALFDRHPRNVIFFLGDGMGTQEITAARYYQGVRNKLNVDRMAITGFDTTWSVKPGPKAPYLPDYDPDSASTGSQWATGQKTVDERISQGPSTALDVPGENLPTVLEKAQKRGMKVGNVSTAEITDATPAVLASHVSLRGCQGPADMAACPKETKAAGGLGSIAEQEVDHNIDVLLGGGRGRFEQKVTGGPDAGKTVVQAAQDKGFQYVTDANGLANVKDTRKPVIGLFNGGNMSLEWSGPAAALGKGSAPAPCVENQRPANEPSLADMTTKAIKLLENDRRRGFFLQVEGASIDKQDHATNACGQIGETVAFDRAIGVALDYQRTHPDTLVVVTADHGHTSQIVSEDASGSGLPTGYSTNLVSKDGQTLTLTYGTAGFGGDGKAPAAKAPSQQHTGTVVPVWGNGPGSLALLGTNDHTDLFRVLGG